MLRRILFTLSCLLLCLQSSRVHADEELPSIDQVKERISQTLSLIKTLQVEEKTLRRLRDSNGREEIYELKKECKWTLTSDRKSHSISTGETLRYNNKGATTVPYNVEVAYDGKLARSIRNSSRELTRPFSGTLSPTPTQYTMSPLYFTVVGGRETLLESLNKRPFHVVGEEELYDRNVLVIISDPFERDGWLWNRKYHFDMEFGTQVKTTYMKKKPEAEEWIEYVVWMGLKHEEVIPGVWLPTKYRKYSFNPMPEDGGSTEFTDGFVGAFSNWKVNEPIPANRFKLLFPSNLPVNDQRPMQNGRLLGKDEIKQLNDLVIKELNADPKKP